MHPGYFDLLFRTEEPIHDWPAAFAILTGYATTGEVWPEERNTAADQALRDELATTRSWYRRVTGFSPVTGHAEPGWAVALPWETACDLGAKYLQDAIFYVEGDALTVSHCDPVRRRRIPVGPFRERIVPT